MPKKPERKKKNTLLWIICIAVVLAVILVRVVCQMAGVPLSDTLIRVMGGVQLVAVFVAAFSYARWRFSVSTKSTH